MRHNPASNDHRAREIRSINFVNRPSREYPEFSGVCARRCEKKRERKKREREGGSGGREVGDALSAPQIAVYVSRGVGYTGIC